MVVSGRRGSAALALLCAALASCGGSGGSSQPSSTGATAAATTATSGKPHLQKLGDFDQPVWITQPPGSSDLYVVERSGRVRILRGDRVLDPPALDITNEVVDSSEQGLLSIAFPPDFQDSRVVYAYYTGNDQDQHVVRFSVRDDGSFDSGSERELLHMDDFASNHNGGLLLFGPDGHMYIGTGDGGIADDPQRNGQDRGSLLGKILQMDPARGARPEICDYGLRNPWRYSFDRETGAFTIGDVGQNEFEEIDYRPPGRACGNNFGWSAFEGNSRFNQDQTAPNAVAPILVYNHDEGCSVTGGYVVRDPALPSLEGRYLYGDYCEGELRSFRPAVRRAIDDHPLGIHVDSLSSFGEDNEGHIYVISLDGPVYRLLQ